MYPMYRKSLIATAVALMAAGLVACGGGDDDDDDNGPDPVEVGDAVALTADGRLFSFDRADPENEVGSVEVSGLADGETLVGMDFRPADGRLYAVSSLGKIYRVDPSTGETDDLGPLVAAVGDNDPYTALSGTRFGVDWNPTADALRVVSDTGQNLRILPTARMADATGGTNPVQQPALAAITDGALTQGGAAATNVSAAAYTNSFDAATTTALYVLDPDNDSVYLQNPPNAGTLVDPTALGVDFDAVNGFDIDPGSNLGYAALTVGGSTQLYTLPVGTVAGAATAVGTIGDGSDPIVGLALNTPATPTVLALTTDNRLFSFNPRTPNTASTPVAISGLAANETVVGIDVRPLDGMLYAVARDTTNGNGAVYSVDPATGAATAAYDLVQVGTSTPVVLADAVYSVDFNPAADALRIINDDGLNLRVFPSDRDVMGTARVAGDTVTDTPLSRVSGAPVVVASAYTSSRVSTTRPASTMLFNLETNSDVLTRQDANAGVLTDVGSLGTGIDAGTMAGFDIGGATSSDGTSNGLVLAALGGATGPYRLYTVNLATGAAALPRGLTNDTALIGGASGTTLRDIAIRF